VFSGVKDDGAVALGTALETNKSIKVLILETNHISGDAIKTLLQSLAKNTTLEGEKRCGGVAIDP
jgi:hypothetical protein